MLLLALRNYLVLEREEKLLASAAGEKFGKVKCMCFDSRFLLVTAIGFASHRALWMYKSSDVRYLLSSP